MTKHVTMFVGLIMAAGLLSAGLSLAVAADDEEVTIKVVMEEAHKSGLQKKVANGQASDEEKAKLLVLYQALAGNQPPQGDADSWQTRTAALVAAAQAAVNGDADAGAKLQAAADCKGCHDIHKPAQK